jgi:hypothetical protein
MEVVETPDSIKIQFATDDLRYQSVYNREYFLLLGIKIVESEDEKNVAGLHQYLKKKKNQSLIESVDDSIEKGESKLENFFNESSRKSELVIRKNKKFEFKTLDSEIVEVRERPKTIFNFDSGFTYDEYSNIVKDLYIQLAYLDFMKLKIEEIDYERVFKINGRYVLLENELKEREKQEREEHAEDRRFPELERRMVELTGKEYEKGQMERDLKMIEGTEIRKYREILM